MWHYAQKGKIGKDCDKKEEMFWPSNLFICMLLFINSFSCPGPFHFYYIS